MPVDDKTYNPLRGGIQGEVESSSAVAGTLGCIAETNRPGEQKRIVFLSVAHLLYGGLREKANGVITEPGARACHTNACSKCSRCCSNDFGKTLRGEFSPEIDAAIATIYTGRKYLQEVEGLGVIRGAHTITADDAHGPNASYGVRKRGIATQITEGTVRLLDFATDTKTEENEFERRAVNQLMVQPRARVAVPITEIRANGTILANGANFQTNGVTQEHFVEISGPTRNRELYKVHSVISENEIAVSKRTSKRKADLEPEVQRAFTAADGFWTVPNGPNGVRAPGLAANNPNLGPFDMAEIKGSTFNDGIFQIRPLGQGAITPQDEIALSTKLTIEAAGGTQVRGLIFLRVRNEKFSDSKDSGAVLVNSDNQVVGLLAGKVEMPRRPDLIGYAFGAPIQPVLDRLGISIPSSAAAEGQEQVVSATEGEPPPGGAVALAERLEERALLLRAQDELLASEPGRKYAELVETHRPEVQTLINTNRRVAVAWQRNGGPLFFQLALNAVQHPDAVIPREINGRSLDTCITNILQAFDEHGSVALRSDVAKFGYVWKLLPGTSFNELKSKVMHG